MKLGYALAAIAAITLAIPSLASAETTIIKKVHRDGPRAEFRHHHRGHNKKVVIIKHRGGHRH